MNEFGCLLSKDEGFQLLLVKHALVSFFLQSWVDYFVLDAASKQWVKARKEVTTLSGGSLDRVLSTSLLLFLAHMDEIISY